LPETQWEPAAVGFFQMNKLVLFPALHKFSLGLEIPLIWSFFDKKLPGTSLQQVPGCSIIDGPQGICCQNRLYLKLAYLLR
jgi:hypothetical protein